MIGYMVGKLRGAWMWWCRIKELIIGGGGARIPHSKFLLVIQQYSLPLMGHLLLVTINRYGIVDVIGVIECCIR